VSLWGPRRIPIGRFGIGEQAPSAGLSRSADAIYGAGHRSGCFQWSVHMGGFQTVRAALDDYAYAVAARTSGERPKTVGLFTATSPRRLPNGGVSFVLHVSGTFLSLEEYGMAYLPKGVGDGRDFDELDSHLGGSWYLWESD
jgi:hypothetical protein